MQQQGRLRLRAWLEEQIHSGRYPGVSWLDRSAQIFQIPWKHAARHGWSIDQDATLFRSWAMHTGRYQPGKDKPDPKTWKANFRCALNSLTDICELREHSRKKGSNAFRVYRMLPTRQPLRRKRGQRFLSRPRDRCTTHSQPPATVKSSQDPVCKVVTTAQDATGSTHGMPIDCKPDEQEQKEAVFKLMDHLNNADSWSHTYEQRTWRTHTPGNHWHWAGEDNPYSVQAESYNDLFPNYIKELTDWSSYHQTVMQ